MPSTIERFCGQLTADERMLITLRDELYDGSWDQMLKDLRDRLEGKPYIFKLVNRISADIQRIQKLSDFERKHRVNLAEHLKKREKEEKR